MAFVHSGMGYETTGDIERDGKRDDYLVNHTVETFTWRDLSADVQLGRSKTQIILSEVDGLVSAGKGIRTDVFSYSRSSRR